MRCKNLKHVLLQISAVIYSYRDYAYGDYIQGKRLLYLHILLHIHKKSYLYRLENVEKNEVLGYGCITARKCSNTLGILNAPAVKFMYGIEKMTDILDVNKYSRSNKENKGDL